MFIKFLKSKLSDMELLSRKCHYRVCLKEKSRGTRKISFCEAYHKKCAHYRRREIEESVRAHNNYQNKDKIDFQRLEKALIQIEKGIDADLQSNSSLQSKAYSAFTVQGLLLSVVIGLVGSNENLFFILFSQRISVYLVPCFILFSIISSYFGIKVIQPKQFWGKGTTVQGWLDLDYLEKTDPSLQNSLHLALLGDYALASHQNSLSLRTNN